MRREAARDLGDLRAVGRRLQGVDTRERARREPTRARVAVVVVDLLVGNRDAGGLDCAHDLLGALRGARHAPVLAARAQGVAHLRRARVEEADAPLRDERLEHFVRLDRKVHAARVGADEHVVVREEQVGGVGPLGHRLALRERGLPGLRAQPVQFVRPGDALHGVDAPAGDEAGRAEEERADAGLQRAVGVLREKGVAENLHVVRPFVRFRACSRGAW